MTNKDKQDQANEEIPTSKDSQQIIIPAPEFMREEETTKRQSSIIHSLSELLTKIHYRVVARISDHERLNIDLNQANLPTLIDEAIRSLNLPLDSELNKSLKSHIYHIPPFSESFYKLILTPLSFDSINYQSYLSSGEIGVSGEAQTYSRCNGKFLIHAINSNGVLDPNDPKFSRKVSEDVTMILEGDEKNLIVAVADGVGSSYNSKNEKNGLYSAHATTLLLANILNLQIHPELATKLASEMLSLYTDQCKAAGIAISFYDNTLTASWLGDCVSYSFNLINGKYQFTPESHTFPHNFGFYDSIQHGTPNSYYNSPVQNRIYSYFGQNGRSLVEETMMSKSRSSLEVNFPSQAICLVGSDPLLNYTSPFEVEKILNEESTEQEALRRIFYTILERSNKRGTFSLNTTPQTSIIVSKSHPDDTSLVLVKNYS